MKNPPDEAIVRVPAPEKESLTWEEQSGFLEFLGAVSGEVATFNDSHEFGLHYEISPPATIDGSRDKAEQVGFVVTRRTKESFTDTRYCLYSIFLEQSLHGYIGVSEQGKIETICKLEPLTDFDEGTSMLYDWLRTLIEIATSEAQKEYF